MAELVVLERCGSRPEAELVASRLRSEGIRVMVRADDAGGMGPNLAPHRGIEILVNPEDLEMARELLA
ncbi:hypothetical protein BH23ACT5_BH23ACT5_22780 [soil metagenome]